MTPKIKLSDRVQVGDLVSRKFPFSVNESFDPDMVAAIQSDTITTVSLASTYYIQYTYSINDFNQSFDQPGYRGHTK